MIVDISKNEIVYIGQTKKNIELRYKQHVSDFKRLQKYEYLRDNECKIELIETVEFVRSRKREQYWINTYKPILNKINSTDQTIKGFDSFTF